MLVVADQLALGVGAEGRLARARESEEDSGLRLILIRISRAVHRGNATKRVEVVHIGEHTLLHLTAVPGVEDELYLFC